MSMLLGFASLYYLSFFIEMSDWDFVFEDYFFFPSIDMQRFKSPITGCVMVCGII